MSRATTRYLIWSIVVIAVARGPFAIAATDAGEPKVHEARPKIGLVLGGGGARGAAHIGVLRELERLRIPVDAIAGISMGAIVGGLYAAGMSPTELQELVETLDWAEALSDAPRRRDLSFRRKQDDEQFPVDIGVGVQGGQLVLPKGLLQGQKLDLLLRELTLGVSHISNYDDLNIPFRAVAADIETGEAHVMSHGDLARSIRASMTVPGVFAPVFVDGRLLVDGGVVGNVPVDVMQEMGVDVIIAVDVDFPLYKLEELDSVLTVSEQIISIMMRRETLRQIDRLGEQDILIRPDLGMFGSSDFAGVAKAIEPGARATQAFADQLQVYSLSTEEYSQHIANRVRPDKSGKQLAFVRVVDDARISKEVLESRLSVQPGDMVDAKQLAADANRLYGLRLYEQASYQLLEEGGETGVEFRARTTSWGPNYLQFAVALEDDFEGSTGFNLGARLTRTGLNPLGAEWRTDLQIGTDPLLSSEFYQPVSVDSRYFIAPRATLWQSNFNAFVDDENVARYRVSEAEVGLDVGTEFGTSAELRIGVFSGTGKAGLKTGDPSLPNFDFGTGGVMARYRYDSFDNAWFPRQGVRAGVDWILSSPGLGADDSFESIDTGISAAWSRGKSTLQLGLNYSTNTGSAAEVQDYFPLGGFLRLSGLERDEISGPHAALGRLVYYRRVGNSAGGVLEMPVYLGASIEAGNVWQNRSDISFGSLRTNGSIFAGLDTFFGPVILATGFAEGGERNIYLYIGALPR